MKRACQSPRKVRTWEQLVELDRARRKLMPEWLDQVREPLDDHRWVRQARAAKEATDARTQ